MPKRNQTKRAIHLKKIAAHVDTSVWNVERVADQLQSEQLAAALRHEVKLLRRYAQWLRLEAERRTEPEPESS